MSSSRHPQPDRRCIDPSLDPVEALEEDSENSKWLCKHRHFQTEYGCTGLFKDGGGETLLKNMRIWDGDDWVSSPDTHYCFRQRPDIQ